MKAVDSLLPLLLMLVLLLVVVRLRMSSGGDKFHLNRQLSLLFLPSA